MGPKTREIPAFLLMFVMLAVSYAVGSLAGFRLTGSLLGAAACGFLLPCISMFGLILYAASTRGTASE